MTAKKYLEKIDKNTIAEYKKDLRYIKKLSNSSINRKLSSLRKFLAWANDKNYLDSNPLDNKDHKRNKKSLSVNEKPTLAAQVYSNYRQFVKYGSVISITVIIILLMLEKIPFIDIKRREITQITQPIAASYSPWIIMFEGKILDNDGKPIINTGDITFSIYAQEKGGNPLWTSKQWQLTPAADGTFSVPLGNTELGDAEINSDLFFQYKNLYVAPTFLGSAESLPRYPVSTASHIIDSFYLRDYPPAIESKPETVPVINKDGKLILASTNPTIKATDGTLKIEGQAITIATPPFSSGNITLAPDGEGSVNLRFSASEGNNLDVRNANLSSGNLYYGYVGNDTTGYNLIDLQSGATPVSRFTVDALGNTNIGGSLAAADNTTLGTSSLNSIKLIGTVSNPNQTYIGIDDNIKFIGTQTITTSLGNLSFAPAGSIDVQKALINSTSSNDGRVYVNDDLQVNGGAFTQSIVNSTTIDTDTIKTIGEARFGDNNNDQVYISGQLNLGTSSTTQTSFVTDSSGDLTIDPTGDDITVGSDLILSDTFTLQIGGLTGTSYNSIADSTDAPDEAAIDADNDLYVGGSLEVDGTIYGSVSGTISPGFTQGSVIFTDGSGNLAQDNSNFYWDDTNDYLGIGINSSLGAHLEINAATTTDTGLIVQTTDDNTTTNLTEWQDSTGNVQVSIGPTGVAVFNEEGNDADFRVEGVGEANALVVQGSDGFVGIGTNSPNSIAEIVDGITHSFATPGTTYGTLTISPEGGNDDSASITFRANNGAGLATGAQAGIYVQSSSAYGTKMYFGTTNSYAVGSQARMMIDNAGNVGIADTTPDDTLDVDGGVNFDLDAGSSFVVDADTADTTVDVLSLDIGTLTGGVDGIVMDLNVTGDTGNDADTFAGINVTANNNTTDQVTDDNIYGVYVQDLGGTALAGNEYAIYQAGTSWDYGLYVEDQCVTGDTKLKRRKKKKRKKKKKGCGCGGKCPCHSSEDSDDTQSVRKSEESENQQVRPSDTPTLRHSDTSDSSSLLSIPNCECTQYIYDEVRIDEIEEGDEILSLNESTGKFEYQKVEKLMDMGVKQTYLLITESGKQIRTTANHPYLTKEKGGQSITIGGTYQIDQSPRLETLNQDSYIAVANKHLQFIARISKKDKKFLKEMYNKKGRSKYWSIDVFAQSVGLLLKHAGIRDAKIQIDKEYTGHETRINEIIRRAVGDMNIEYIRVGHKKDSYAHVASYGAYIGKQIEDIRIKNDRGTLKGVGQGVVTLLDNRQKTGDTRGQSSKYYQNSLELSSSASWRKVYDLKPGMQIATVDGWETIVILKKHDTERVWDIQIANTRNFVGNDIVAHNTYLGGNVTAAGSLSLTGNVDIVIDADAATPIDIGADVFASGTLLDIAYDTAETLTGDTVGQSINLNTNVTGVADGDLSVIQAQTPALTSSGTTTTNYYGLNLSAAGALDTTAAESLVTNVNWYGNYIQMPNIDTGESGDTTSSYGLYLAAGTVTAGAGTENEYGIYIENGDIILDADGGGAAGGSTGGDLILGEGQDLEIYHDGTNSIIANNTGDLQINGAASSDIVLNESGADVDLRIEGNTNSNLLFVDASADAVGIGQNTPTDTLHVAGNIYSTAGIHIGADADANLFDDASNGSTTTVMYIGNETIDTTASDRRLKENITPTKIDVFDIINRFQIVDFDWKEGNSRRDKGRMTGLIAQDVYEYLPQVVKKPDNPKNTWAVEYHHIVPYVIKAVQKQQELITNIQTRLEEIANLLNIDKIVSPIVDTKMLQFQNSEFKIQNSEDKTVFLVNSEGNAEVFGDLIAQEVHADKITTSTISAKLTKSETLIAKEASITGSITSNSLFSQSSQFEELTTETASVSGILFADDVQTSQGKLSELVNRVKHLFESSGSNSLTLAEENDNEASFSALIAKLEATPVYTNNTDVSISQYVEIDQLNTAVEEQFATLTADQYTTGLTPSSLLVDNTLYISGATIDSGQDTLYIQRFANAPVNIMNGQLVIDTNGDVFVNKNLKVQGSIAVNTIKPLQNGNLTIDLSQPKYKNATNSGSFASLLPDELREPNGFGKLIIKGAEGIDAVTIDASGSAAFAGDIAANTGEFNKLIIASDNTTPSGMLADTAITSNASTGTSVLPAGTKTITIKSKHVTKDSLIYLTPTSETSNKVLYVAFKKDSESTFDNTGYFQVAIDRPVANNIEFNWWVIN